MVNRSVFGDLAQKDRVKGNNKVHTCNAKDRVFIVHNIVQRY